VRFIKKKVRQQNNSTKLVNKCKKSLPGYFALVKGGVGTPWQTLKKVFWGN